VTVPVLAGIVWLLTLRTSAAEARRFGLTARAMRAEAASLERTVATLSATIETNRAQLAEQTQALAALGDSATTRLAAIGNSLSGEVAQADTHARALSDTTRIAQINLETLIAGLPRARDE